MRRHHQFGVAERLVGGAGRTGRRPVDVRQGRVGGAVGLGQRGVGRERGAVRRERGRDPGLGTGQIVGGPDLLAHRRGDLPDVIPGFGPGDLVDGQTLLAPLAHRSRSGVVGGQSPRGRALIANHLLQIRSAGRDIGFGVGEVGVPKTNVRGGGVADLHQPVIGTVVGVADLAVVAAALDLDHRRDQPVHTARGIPRGALDGAEPRHRGVQLLVGVRQRLGAPLLQADQPFQVCGLTGHPVERHRAGQLLLLGPGDRLGLPQFALGGVAGDQGAGDLALQSRQRLRGLGLDLVGERRLARRRGPAPGGLGEPQHRLGPAFGLGRAVAGRGGHPGRGVVPGLVGVGDAIGVGLILPQGRLVGLGQLALLSRRHPGQRLDIGVLLLELLQLGAVIAHLKQRGLGAPGQPRELIGQPIGDPVRPEVVGAKVGIFVLERLKRVLGRNTLIDKPFLVSRVGIQRIGQVQTGIDAGLTSRTFFFEARLDVTLGLPGDQLVQVLVIVQGWTTAVPQRRIISHRDVVCARLSQLGPLRRDHLLDSRRLAESRHSVPNGTHFVADFPKYPVEIAQPLVGRPLEPAIDPVEERHLRAFQVALPLQPFDMLQFGGAQQVVLLGEARRGGGRVCQIRDQLVPGLIGVLAGPGGVVGGDAQQLGQYRTVDLAAADRRQRDVVVGPRRLVPCRRGLGRDLIDLAAAQADGAPAGLDRGVETPDLLGAPQRRRRHRGQRPHQQHPGRHAADPDRPYGSPDRVETLAQYHQAARDAGEVAGHPLVAQHQ